MDKGNFINECPRCGKQLSLVQKTEQTTGEGAKFSWVCTCGYEKYAYELTWV